MLKIDTYSQVGKKTGSITAPKELSGRINMPLLAQAVRVYKDRQHKGLAKVQTRGEITSISTRKIYRQKGTGGARHGAKSAPIFVGGGIAHGPTGVKRELQLPRRIRRNALEAALSLKLKQTRAVLVAGIDKLDKTKGASTLLAGIKKDLGLKKDASASLVMGDVSEKVSKAFRNIKNLNVYRFPDLNAYKVYLGGLLLLDENIFSKKTVKKSNAVVKKTVKKTVKKIKNK
ncbi:MAG TPA: 50S ribosomal protein L4 [Patescibacteria group bacterium]|nr:50S ribosomal protein L4 [Patescibacteria group bacterium]